MTNFKCLQCNKKFKGNEDIETCPYCGSDNITPYSNNSLILKILLIFVLCICAGFGIMQFVEILLDKNKDNVQEATNVYETANMPQETTTSVINEITEVPEEIVLEKSTMPVFEGNPVPVEKKGRYEISVLAETESGDAINYAIYEIGQETPKYTSEDGNFTDVEASEAESGVYLIVAINMRTGETADKIVAGFIPIKPEPELIEKLTQKQLQDIFNSGTAIPNMQYKFINKYRMHFTGLAEDEPEPDRYEEIFNRLIGVWEAVEVTKVTYNAQNKITDLYIRVIQ